jgi:RNA polymerase sigma factor (sigma-70 family)
MCGSGAHLQDNWSPWFVSNGMDVIGTTVQAPLPEPGAALEDSVTAPPIPLLLEAAAGETFEAIYAAHFRSVYRYALLGTRRRDDAEDVVADTFARAFGAWRSGHGPADRPLPWLLLICRRIVTDRWRRQRLIRWFPLVVRGDAREGREHEIGLDPAAHDRAFEASEFWLWLDALSRALPERQRDVLFLRYERDLTDEEIGEVLGLTASGVRSLVARALASLRSHPELLT